eukprot:496895-Pelagomonas_calceolata.AAC.1
MKACAERAIPAPHCALPQPMHAQASSSQQQREGPEQQELRIAWQYKKYIDGGSQGGSRAEAGASSRRPTSMSGRAAGGPCLSEQAHICVRNGHKRLTSV